MKFRDDTDIMNMILDALDGLDIDDALKILEDCKQMVLTYSTVSFPWNRLLLKQIQKGESK